PSRRPMLDNWTRRNPPDGANCRSHNASRVTRFQYVTSTAARSFKTPISAPASHSVCFSGLRLGLPRLSGARPGPVCEASGPNVVNLSNAPGWRPDCPTAARTRTVENFDRTADVPHPASELGWTEMLAFG